MPASQEIVRLRRLADITHGTVFYDGSRAAACITAIAASSCDRVELAMSRRGERLCEPFERGLVPHGGVCSHDEECASNGCLADSSGCAGACCPGHCTANVAVAAGGECGDDRAVRPWLDVRSRQLPARLPRGKLVRAHRGLRRRPRMPREHLQRAAASR